MSEQKYIRIKNFRNISLDKIPVLDYETAFLPLSNSILSDKSKYIFAYFGKKSNRESSNETILTFMLIADDKEGDILLYSSLMNVGKTYHSVSKDNLCAEKFERELYENFGIKYNDHPWYKPVRYAHDRADKNLLLKDYPYYQSESIHLHEVAVGPVHAGVIEPGSFRFICNGEEILHLEIQLGYQHRGIEYLMLQNKKSSYRLALSEAIAGDTAIAHAYAYCANIESLTETMVPENAKTIRLILLELERIANHTGDIGNLCVGLAFQPVSSIMGKLRGTPLNMMMVISGDRFGKGNLTPGGIRYAIDETKKQKLHEMLKKFSDEFNSTSELFMNSTYSINRVENCGVVNAEKVLSCGFVGYAAKMSGIKRDVRQSHAFDDYKIMNFNTETVQGGDVKARIEIRILEVKQSIEIITKALNKLNTNDRNISLALHPKVEPNQLSVSLIEGFRGVICHVAITDEKGELAAYKIVDPSFHNWLALALACRGVGISDFPINNKSFNQSYCGHDL